MREDSDIEVKYSYAILLRAIRRALRMTQEELANRVGVSRQMLLSYEKSESIPNVKHSEHIAQVLSSEIRARHIDQRLNEESNSGENRG